VLSATDQLDDGSPVTLRVELDPESGGAVFDFTGTSPQVDGGELPDLL
jgi:5-oxoprolinase (ATP-hydrolysing)